MTVIETAPLGHMWPTLDPFLFCVHHDDAYPAANEHFGPAASLAGRQMGADFGGRDGWNMYHGEVVPGFPQHPHRGFETLTFVRRGLIDHSDSLGAIARFGRGDAQWLTAGKGIVHSEMFPLLDREGPNPLELFQIWINLPAKDKLVDPHFTMLWENEIPRRVFTDNGTCEVVVVAGEFFGAKAPAPPPKSWAADPGNDLAVLSILLEPGATCTLPPAKHPETLRMVYFFVGDRMKVAEQSFTEKKAIRVDAAVPTHLEATGSAPCEVLVLQGRPIGEPVAQHGPFVMNTREEIQRAMSDYQSTRFGGWPHGDDAPVHGTDGERFAQRGREAARERPTK